MNRQEIIKYINEEYNTVGEQLWADYPDHLVFRNSRNKKWFAIIMNVDKSKLKLSGDGNADIINFKCDTMLIGSLLCNNGYLPAYHMNKQHWISVLLDGSVDDGEIINLLDLSYNLIDGKARR